MKIITHIYMANADHICEIDSGEELTIKKNKIDSSNIYEMLVDGEASGDWCDTLRDAKQLLKDYATDHGMVTVQGYGTYSGKKFWQLPARLQRQALKMAGFN